MSLHADHSQRIVMDATALLAEGAGECLLETRAVKEQSRIRLLALRAGESWTHDGVRLLEVLVVHGTVSLDGMELGPSSYARLAPGLPATLRSENGGVLYLNERNPAEPTTDSYAVNGAKLEWRQGMVPGLKVASLHQDLPRHTALVRWAPETRFNPHTHVGGEEILVLAGVFRDEHGAYPAGTWIRSPHLSNHRPFTGPEGATILVKVGHLDVA
jgi:hypothetical protein